MALSTYAELQASVAGWLHRDDIEAEIRDGIALCEVELQALRVQKMLTRARSTVDAEYETLPTATVDVLDLESVSLPNQAQDELKIVSDNTIIGMKSADPDRTGQPTHVALTDGALHFFPAPDTTYLVETTYYRRVPALSDSNTSNWVLTSYPNAYLYGALTHMAGFARDREDVPMWESKFQRALQSIRDADPKPRRTKLVVDAIMSTRGGFNSRARL